MPTKISFINILLACAVTVLLAACGKADYEDLQGNRDNFADLQPHWLVINYWASWCKPCRIEIPELNRLAEQHKDIHVFAVNYDELGPEQLAQEAKAMGINFNVLLTDPAPLLGYQRPQRLPTTVLIDPQGEVAKILEGLQTEQSLLAVINGEP